MSPSARRLAVSDGVTDNLTFSEVRRLLQGDAVDPVDVARRLVDAAYARSHQTSHPRAKIYDITAVAAHVRRARRQAAEAPRRRGSEDRRTNADRVGHRPNPECGWTRRCRRSVGRFRVAVRARQYVGPVPSAADRAIESHERRWGDPEHLVRAPGRVNLIGEHTDYNEGFAMPMALPFDTVVAMSSVGDQVSGAVTVSSAGFGDLTFEPAADLVIVPTWARHVAGCVALLVEGGIPAGGWRASIDTDIPTGASLSSSAALEVAVISALVARAGESWPPIEVAARSTCRERGRRTAERNHGSVHLGGRGGRPRQPDGLSRRRRWSRSRCRTS